VGPRNLVLDDSRDLPQEGVCLCTEMERVIVNNRDYAKVGVQRRCRYLPNFLDIIFSHCILVECLLCQYAKRVVMCSYFMCKTCNCSLIAGAVPPRPQDGTGSVIVLFTIVSSCVTDCNV